MTFIERDCTIEHEGRAFTAGGAMVTPDRLIAYVGKQENRAGSLIPIHTLTDWHGHAIGTIRLTSSWRINSYLTDRMYQGYATVNGVTYTGRTCGRGMVYHGKRVAKQ